MDFSSYIERLAKVSIQRQQKEENDYIDDEGLLVCGTCGKRRQARKEFPCAIEVDPSGKREILVAICCDCDKEKAEFEKMKKEEEERKEAIKSLRASSLMDLRYENATFETFEVNDFNRKNFKICRNYAMRFDEMKEKNQGLLMVGGVGTGKSYAAACIANFLLQKNIPVVMTSFVKILSVLDSEWGEAENIIGKINKASLVIFDDLGAERHSDAAIEKVYNIVDSRYRSNLPMIITTNITFNEMKTEQGMRYTRVYDRIIERCYPMQFTGPSRRPTAMAHNWKSMKEILEEDI